MDGHHYLDTKFYRCTSCARSFNGYNKRSLQLDAVQWAGVFPFHLSKTFAVDGLLYSHIVNSASQTTASIQQQYCQRVKDKYLGDLQYYHYAVRSKKIRHEVPARVRGDRSQPTLDSHLQPVVELADMQNTERAMKTIIRSNKMKYLSANALAKDDIDFVALKALKEGKNGRKAPLKGIGSDKLDRLICQGVSNARQLLYYDDVHHSFKRTIGRQEICLVDKWKELATGIFADRDEAAKEAYEEWQTSVCQLESIKELVAIDNAAFAPDVPVDEEEPAEAIAKPPAFSDLRDKDGYAARFLLKSRIDAIIATEFHHRKAVQDGKMRGQSGVMLKIDFNYKLAQKIRVHWSEPDDAHVTPSKSTVVFTIGARPRSTQVSESISPRSPTVL